MRRFFVCLRVRRPRNCKTARNSLREAEEAYGVVYIESPRSERTQSGVRLRLASQLQVARLRGQETRQGQCRYCPKDDSPAPGTEKHGPTSLSMLARYRRAKPTFRSAPSPLAVMRAIPIHSLSLSRHARYSMPARGSITVYVIAIHSIELSLAHRGRCQLASIFSCNSAYTDDSAVVE